jgi:hypothetical protein
MAHAAKIAATGSVWLVISAFAPACSGGGFTGASKSGGSSKEVNTGAGDDDDETCDPTVDADCAGGTSVGGGDDANGDGIPDSQQGTGTNTAGGDDGNPDKNNDGIPDKDQGLDDDGNPVTNSLLENGTANFTHRDNAGTLVLQRLVNGTAEGAAISVDMSDEDKVGEQLLTKACHTLKATCFQIKWVGKVEQLLGRDSCIIVTAQDTNSLTINADGDGDASIGSCVSGPDETFTITCPRGIEPQGCTG